MLHWVQERDWEKAFSAVIPKRKLKGSGGEVDEDEEDEGCSIVQVEAEDGESHG